MPISNQRVVFHALALVVLTTLTRLPLLVQKQAIDDETTYAVVAHTILDRGQPYVDAIERKPPLLFYVYAVTLGAFGRFNWRALHATELVWILATMAGLFVIGRRLFNPTCGLIAALFYSIFQAWGCWQNLAFNGEVLMNLPIVWAYAIGLFSRRRLALSVAGFLLALAFLLKQPAAIAIIPLGSLLLLPDVNHETDTLADRLLRAGCLTIGFFGTLIAAGVWLHSRELLAEAFYWTVTNHEVPYVFWQKGFVHTVEFVTFCLPITAGAWMSIRNAGIWSGGHRARAALVGWTIAIAIGAAQSGRFYPHYYIALVPPCAVLAAPLFARLWADDRRAEFRRMAYVSWVWLGATIVVFGAAHVRGLASQPEETAAGEYLRQHSAADDRVFVWGQAPRIYLDARRRPASRYIATFPLTGWIFGPPIVRPDGRAVDTRHRIVPGSWNKLEEDFARHPPSYIIDAEASTESRYPISQFSVMRQLLESAYEPVARTVDGVIYRRRLDADLVRSPAPGRALAPSGYTLLDQ
jgi:4-amino-4-deoxy-L-arabinose transferase-like glycosyltransferase